MPAPGNSSRTMAGPEGRYADLDKSLGIQAEQLDVVRAGNQQPEQPIRSALGGSYGEAGRAVGRAGGVLAHKPRRLGGERSEPTEGDERTHNREPRADPEPKHPADQGLLGFGQLDPELGTQLRDATVELCFKLGEPLLQLRVEQREVVRVNLPQVAPVGGVHVIEPVGQLPGDILAKALIELQ